MKKICLVLVLLFASLSVLPADAMKVIKNTESSRIVPSRSTNLDFIKAMYDDYKDSFNAPEYEREMYNPNNIENVNYTNRYGYQGELYETYYKPIVENDIRTELIGTNWTYPKQESNNYQNRPVPVQNQRPRMDDDVEEGGYVIASPKNAKGTVREAADYFIEEYEHLKFD